MKKPEPATDTPADDERKYRAPALEKGLDILELLARNGAPMTASQMAATLGRSVSELFRMVLALEFRGYIEPAGDGRDGYFLTNKLFTLGISQGATRSLLETALPVMKELTRELGQSCHLGVASGDQLVVVGRVESPMDLGFSVRVGYRARLIDTISGQLLFAYAPETTKQRWLAQLRTSASEREIAAFIAKAEAAAARGHVQSPSDFVDGVTDCGVPILGIHGTTATLVVPFLQIKGQALTPELVLQRLKSASGRIAEALGNEGS